MPTRLISIIIISLLMLGIFGCQQEPVSKTSTSRTVTFREDMISVQLLASQLGLRVDEINGTHVKLKNASNTVLIFTHVGGKFYVNGKEIGPVGEITKRDGSVYVQQSIAAKIRSAMQTRTTFEPSVPSRLSGTVVIDPGHGGNDPGATSVTGYYEKTVNLPVAHKVTARLRQRGINVIMTRQGDSRVELERRAEIANQHRADLFVSIHADSHPDRSTRGYTVYIGESASTGSQAAARAIAQRLSQVTASGNGIRRENFRVLVRTTMPAVLVEMGYLSNYPEANLLTTDHYQNQIAQAISDGICDVIGRL